jgi:hypothetical protein
MTFNHETTTASLPGLTWFNPLLHLRSLLSDQNKNQIQKLKSQLLEWVSTLESSPRIPLRRVLRGICSRRKRRRRSAADEPVQLHQEFNQHYLTKKSARKKYVSFSKKDNVVIYDTHWPEENVEDDEDNMSTGKAEGALSRGLA